MKTRIETWLPPDHRQHLVAPGWRAACQCWFRFQIRLAAVFTVLVLSMPGLSWAGPNALVLDNATPTIQAWPAVTVLADVKKSLTIDQVLSMQEGFKPPTTAFATLGLREDAVWLRIPLSVAANSGGLWVVDIDYAVINHIDLYLVTNSKVVEQAKTGNLLPREQRPANSRAHSMGLSLKAGQSYDIYLRIDNIGAMILPITLNTPAAFHARALDEQMLQGLLSGLALCLLVYSLAQWFSLGEHLFVKYAILISGGLLFSLLQFGVGSQYIWPSNNWMELHMGGLSALIAATGSFLFIEHAMVGPDIKPVLSRLMKFGAGLTVFFAVLFALDWIDVYQVTAVISTLGLAPALLGLPGALFRARRGDSVGIYFLLAWVVYFVTTAVLIEVIKGRVGANFWTMHSFQFGATFDMLIFMRVLGLRTKALQLAFRNANLERDNLRFLAHTDPLTGLANRRSLNDSISAAVQYATTEKILAVYMLDLDGFKQVNDQYGHDIGDELLIEVATRLKANLRASDVVSRLGGDEFLVMSIGLKTAQQAQELGEELLRAFNKPFALSTQTCRIGMTIGYALAPHDGTGAAALLKRADAAMYAGKQNGKNCVRRVAGSEGLS